MKILKQPPTIKQWTLEYTCSECTALLEINADDINAKFIVDADLRKRLSYWEYVIKCQCCSFECLLDEGMIPGFVLTDLKAYKK